MLFIYKALLQKLPCYLCSLLTFKYSNYNVRSQDILTLAVPPAHIELGKNRFKYCAVDKWNELQKQEVTFSHHT